jgi:thiosulfate/3-mercaptopyruvate sulfurtransferase
VHALALSLARWGIAPDTWVVALDEGAGAYAAHLWWLLRWVGHRRTTVLNGGFKAWLAAGMPVERGPSLRSGLAPAVTPAIWPQAGQMPVMGADELQRALAAGAIALVDVRTPERFLGEAEPIDAVAGRVPGAVNLPFTGNLGATGEFADPGTLAIRYGPFAGQQAVFMCGSGVTACHGIFARELAGQGTATLYPGSWSEWIRDPQRPVATG